MTHSDRSTAWRLSVYYVAVFGMIGVHMPFWPVWLAARGLGAEEIGVVLAAGTAAKIVGNPLAAHIADRRGERRRSMLILAAASAGIFALFGLTHSFWPILFLTLLFFGLWAPIMPLGESLAMLAVGRGGIDYGRVRLWGSISFIAAAIVAGWMITGNDSQLIYGMVVAWLGLVVAVMFVLPDERTPSAVGRLPIGAVLSDRRFLIFLLSASLVQSSHAVYYGFATLHWKSVGYSAAVVGGLWAEGVIAEVILFIFAKPILARIGPERMLVLAGLAAGLRWTVTALSDSLPALIAVQTLHAFTFGAAHLGAIFFISRAVPPSHSATAQSLYSAVVMGLAMGGAMLAAGGMFGFIGPRAFLVMGAMGALGAIVGLALTTNRFAPKPLDG